MFFSSLPYSELENPSSEYWYSYTPWSYLMKKKDGNSGGVLLDKEIFTRNTKIYWHWKMSMKWNENIQKWACRIQIYFLRCLQKLRNPLIQLSSKSLDGKAWSLFLFINELSFKVSLRDIRFYTSVWILPPRIVEYTTVTTVLAVAID